LSVLVSISRTYRFTDHWDSPLTWNRAVTRYDRDSDVILAGVGYRWLRTLNSTCTTRALDGFFQSVAWLCFGHFPAAVSICGMSSKGGAHATAITYAWLSKPTTVQRVPGKHETLRRTSVFDRRTICVGSRCKALDRPKGVLDHSSKAEPYWRNRLPSHAARSVRWKRKPVDTGMGTAVQRILACSDGPQSLRHYRVRQY
jgi:hypothetical protein